MAYATTNPPALKTQRVGSTLGQATWAYQSVDAAAVVNGASYFADGDALGMQVGDVVEILDTDAPLVTLAFVSAVVADGAASTTAM
jgi:hypothetical protein|tara:strand:- start:7747 stop:8004 length:258 start_codon:yes stop_codon:yes gene_type:complete